MYGPVRTVLWADGGRFAVPSDPILSMLSLGHFVMYLITKRGLFPNIPISDISTCSGFGVQFTLDLSDKFFQVFVIGFHFISQIFRCLKPMIPRYHIQFRLVPLAINSLCPV